MLHFSSPHRHFAVQYVARDFGTFVPLVDPVIRSRRGGCLSKLQQAPCFPARLFILTGDAFLV